MDIISKKRKFPKKHFKKTFSSILWEWKSNFSFENAIALLTKAQLESLAFSKNHQMLVC